MALPIKTCLSFKTFITCATRHSKRCCCDYAKAMLDLNDKDATKNLRVFSGIQPTGEPHIGNYLGAIKNWVGLQNKFGDVIYSVVDLHAITLPQDPVILRENIMTMFASLIACGLDPDRSIVFRQSDVPYHTELSWILSNHCTVNKLQGMVHWKEKSQLHNLASVGLLTYPILQAADILLYKTTGVPVGKDQHQHIRLTRDLAHYFNVRFGDFFPLPQIIVSETPSIKSLSDPNKKMSKSDPNTKCRIDLTDSPDEIKHKIQKSVTDNLGKITYSHELRPGVSNLIDIHAGMANKTSAEICDDHKDLSVGQYKQRVTDAVIEGLKPIQEQYKTLLNDRSYLQNLMTKGSEKATNIAVENIKQVKTLLGIL